MVMFKQSIALILGSLLILFGMTYAQHLVQFIISAHEWISEILTNVFSGGNVGTLLRGLLALVSIPIIAGLIPAFIYWMAKRNWFPYFMEIVWVIWLIQAGALIVAYKVVAG